MRFLINRHRGGSIGLQDFLKDKFAVSIMIVFYLVKRTYFDGCKVTTEGGGVDVVKVKDDFGGKCAPVGL
jgi:hypothetical protein